MTVTRWIPPAAAGLVAAVALAAATAALAADPVNTTADGVALRGHDAVAYFTEGRPVPGQAEFQTSWNGATWRFASAANRDAFARDPERYAPRYGGYCAWAVSQGYTADIDPSAWRVVDGRLYLNYSKRIQRRWEQDVAGHIASADRNWPGVLTK